MSGQWLSVSVRHDSPLCIGHVEYRIRLTNEPFRVELEYPYGYKSALSDYDFDFWLTLSGTDAPNAVGMETGNAWNAEVYLKAKTDPSVD